MVANKQEISCNGSGLSSRRRIFPTADVQTKADAFATTHWSLVVIAQGQSAAAEERWKNFVRFTGDLCTLLLVDKVPTQRKRGI